jgi:hypothetical protein
VVPDGAPDEAVRLDYKLAGEPKEVRHNPPGAEEGNSLWLYDEFDVVKRDGLVAYTHSILFSGDRELQIYFYDLDWGIYRKVTQELSLTGDPREVTAAAG